MEGGYKCRFVDPPPDVLVCMVCYHVAKEAHQVECCGKVFCKTCISEVKDRIGSCPNCRKREPKVFKDQRTSRDVKRLKVGCDKEGKGCEWSGALEDYDAHKAECKFVEVCCSNWPGCRLKIQRQLLEEHLKEECEAREEECETCHQKILHVRMPLHHTKCPKAEIKCSNSGCSVQIFREQLKAHKNVCPKEVISCPYKNSGCKTVILREDREKHLQENIERHSNIADSTIAELENHNSNVVQSLSQSLDEVRDELKKARSQLESRRVVPVTFKMSDYREKKRWHSTWTSPPFFTHASGYKMRLTVTVSSTGTAGYLSAYLQIVPSSNDDELVWPFSGCVTVEILNQDQENGKFSKRITWPSSLPESARRPNIFENARIGRPNFISHTILENDSSGYLKDNCVYFRISNVQVASQCKPWLICSP